MAVGLFVTAKLLASQTNQTYTFPEKTEYAKVVARGGAVTIKDGASGVATTIQDNEAKEFRGQIGGEQIVYTTGVGVTLEIFVQKSAA